MRMAELVWRALVVVSTAVAQGTDAACPQGCLCDQRKQYINCHNAGLTAIPWNLPDPIGLTYLDFSGNDLTELYSQIVSYNNLQVLDLSNCGIEKINFGVFKYLVNLKKLILRNNRLELTKGAFEGLHKLEELDLSGNTIVDVPDNIFSTLASLRVLNFANNKVSLYPNAFDGLGNLSELSLYNNHLYAIPKEALNRVPNLVTLNVGGNRISSLDAESMPSFTAIINLLINENMISDISENAFKSYGTLEYLSLKNNSLKTIPTPALSYLSKLNKLDLSENLFFVIDPDALKGQVELMDLSLTSMQHLEVVRSYAFSELPKLENVHLHSNPRLEKIEEHAFIGSTQLKHVDLHGNNLVTLNENVLPWSSLVYLDLAGNRWNCECELVFLTKLKKGLLDCNGNETVQCSSPQKLANEPITRLDASSFVCDVVKQKLRNEQVNDAVLFGMFAVICGVLIIVLILVLVYRKHAFNGTSYPMQVSYHDYGMPSGARGVEPLRDVVANGSVTRSRPPRRPGRRRLYRKNKSGRSEIKRASDLIPTVAQPPPPVIVNIGMEPSSVKDRRNTMSSSKPPTLDIVMEEEEEEDEAFSESESGENLLV